MAAASGEPGTAFKVIGVCQVVSLPIAVILEALVQSGAVPEQAVAFAAAIVFVLNLWSCCYLSVFDWRMRRLPTPVVRPMYASGAAFSILLVARSAGAGVLFADVLVDAATRMAIGVGIVAVACAIPVLMELCGRKKVGARNGTVAPMGGGDARLMLAMGLQLGPDVLLAIGVACLLGIALAAIIRSRSFPFGPCLALPGMVLALLQLV